MAYRYCALHCGLELAWLICFVESFSKACGLHSGTINETQLNSDGAQNKAAATPAQSRHEQGDLFDHQDAAPADLPILLDLSYSCQALVACFFPLLVCWLLFALC